MRLITVGIFFSVWFYADIAMILASLYKKKKRRRRRRRKRSILKYACTKEHRNVAYLGYNDKLQTYPRSMKYVIPTM